ncbi:hypothetical protein CYMTET_4044 [Cymbomonas tetramitiformis]|uniref:Uncharacterized protein n=1 Tax=Cymbomonas tetramitiformis TaxID=36881 RepID=A0AAE0H2D7_9CHLO|nr:hypothetical protein CYMTET_4044 [Cymbomonas tetramitiformis]
MMFVLQLGALFEFLREWRRVLLHLRHLCQQLQCRILHRLHRSPGEAGAGLRTSLRGIPNWGFGLLAPAKGGGGTVQRSLEEQYLLAAVAPEPPEPTTPLSTPVMVNPDEHKKRPFDEALYLVAAATPTPPGLTTKKKLGEQVSAAIEKLTTPKLRSKVAVATTDNLRC